MRRFIVRAVVITIALFALYFSAIGIQQYVFGNVHAVVVGQVYRSAQLSPKHLMQVKAEHRIKSVINLRGENIGSPWYDDELATSKALGIKHIDFRMKSSRELTDEQARELVALMKAAPKPMLIHCHAGADRTGLASAIYVAAIAKGSEEEAEAQLSLRYGHLTYFPFWWTSAQAMARTFERLEPVFGFYDS